MKIEESLIKQIKISALERLDPITIIVEDVAHGKAHVTIKCYDKSWTSYWGAMGGSVKDFFTRCNVHYLVNCFDRGISPTTDEKDVHEMTKTFHKKIRELILEKRRDEYISKIEARGLWNHLDYIRFYNVIPEHDHECFSWNIDSWDFISEYWSKLFHYENYWSGESEEFQYWLWENVPFVYERNHEYDYLCRIVEVVKKVLSEEEVSDKNIKDFK